MCTQELKRIGWCLRDFACAGAFVAVLACVEATRAQIVIPGADGSDGALNVTSANVTIDLGLAETQTDWEIRPNPNPGEGVYDPFRWAVIYRYTSVNIASGRYVYFANHPKGAPVVWLVSGDVTINGALMLDGSNNQSCQPAKPGPGGFRGAAGGTNQDLPPSDGWGPGGGIRVHGSGQRGASFGTTGGIYGSNTPASPTYGWAFLVPLIGGSGGSSLFNTYADCHGGGGGGGALLIASTGTIAINGGIYARGGAGNYGSGGSGGGVRLVADLVTGTGSLTATGGGGYGTANGGAGRIAVNANIMPTSLASNPGYEPFSPVSDPVVIWPDDAPLDEPIPMIMVTRLTVNGNDIAAPLDPGAQIAYPSADLMFETQHPVVAHISALNVRLNWTVELRVVPRNGPSFVVTADPLQGTDQASTTTATIEAEDMPRGFGAFQVRAYKP